MYLLSNILASLWPPSSPLAYDTKELLTSTKYQALFENRVNRHRGTIELVEVGTKKFIKIEKGLILSVGRTGTVYKCQIVGETALLAVKEPHAGVMAARDLIHEANMMKMLKGLSHCVYQGQLYSDGELFRLITPRQRETLIELLINHTLTMTMKLEIASQLMRAVEGQLSREVIQLNLTMDNIFFNRLGSIQIGDFGSSLYMPPISDPDDLDRSLDEILAFIDEHSYNNEGENWPLDLGFAEFIGSTDQAKMLQIRVLQLIKLTHTTKMPIQEIIEEQIYKYTLTRTHARSLAHSILGMNLYFLFVGFFPEPGSDFKELEEALKGNPELCEQIKSLIVKKA